MSNDLNRTDLAAKLFDRLRVVALLVALVVAALLLPAPWRLTGELATRRVTAARDLDGVLEAVTLGGACIAVWLLLAWLSVIGGLTLVARTPGTLGRLARAVLARITPGFLRRSMAIGMSIGALTGVATSTAPSTAGVPVSASVSIDSAAPGSGPPVPAGRLVGSIDRAASAVAEGADRVGDRATGISPARIGLLLTADGSVHHAWPVGPGAATTGTAVSGAAVSGTAMSGTAVLGTATPETDSSGTAARGVPSPMPAAEIDLDWPVHRPASTPVDLDWPVPATVVVHRGDTLWDIAARQLGPTATDAQIDAGWRSWYAANRAVIGDHPDLILPGQQLQAPATPAP